MTSTTREAFERVVDAICCKRALPFVGAGVSERSKYEGPKRYRPSTRNLARRLARHLLKHAEESQHARSALEGALGENFKGEKKIMRLGLPWLAQLVLQLDSDEHQALCKILDVRRFCRLRPTAAHRYLAFLAREGLLPKVITTNFDRCLETAFEESKAVHLLPDGRPVVCHAVFDTDSNASRRANGLMLTVYKINGCAGSYTGDRASSRRIALTELDLQTWHGEDWAKHLFADAVGDSALVLTGFGGEEAQVRFAVAALTKVFKSHQEPVSPAAAAHQPNAPFVHAFEPRLNRFQQQILYAWFEARAAGLERRTLTAEQRLLYMYANAFTGAHAAFFRDDDSKLTADRFWEAVFMAVWRRKLCEELSVGSTGSYLKQVGFDPDQLAEGICSALFVGTEDQCDHCDLLELPSSTDEEAALPLVRGIEAVLQRRPGHLGSSGRYVALSDKGLLLGLFFLFVAWSRSSTVVRGSSFNADEKMGLRLGHYRIQTTGPEVWLAAQSPARGRDDGVGAVDDCPDFVRILLFTDGRQYYSPQGARAWRILERELSESNDEIPTELGRKGVAVDASGLLDRTQRALDSGSGAAWVSFCKILDGILTNSLSELREYLPSHRHRTEPLE